MWQLGSVSLAWGGAGVSLHTSDVAEVGAGWGRRDGTSFSQTLRVFQAGELSPTQEKVDCLQDLFEGLLFPFKEEQVKNVGWPWLTCISCKTEGVGSELHESLLRVLSAGLRECGVSLPDIEDL